jgi:hypothetical protein
MDTLAIVVVSLSGWASAHPRLPSVPEGPDTQQPMHSMRVWVGLPKKAALYTMHLP